MEYEDVFELLEAVRTYELKKGECLIPSNSVKGTHLGFCTADGEDPSVYWTISVEDFKASCEGRTSEEAQKVYRRMRFFHTRRAFLEDLRSGKLVLEEKPGMPVAPPPPEPQPEEPQEDPQEEDDLEEFLKNFDF